MTTAELSAWGIPMILVPLPTAAADHQTHNAVALERAGAAIHLPQKDATGEAIARLLDGLLREPMRLRSLADGALRRARPDAARLIAGRALAVARRA
jgi:UDP-N-acetylglucosamine--N-acetylmuramyl-(pentapeptide) pyrophosphoryl-undecaprenol N-acetylglucosamine transferase